MLKNILKEISVAKIFSKSQIAKNLNISETMVEDAIGQLNRMGYITEDMGSPTCETKCSGCSISSCNIIPIKTLSLTDKGNKLLGKF